MARFFHSNGKRRLGRERHQRERIRFCESFIKKNVWPKGLPRLRFASAKSAGMGRRAKTIIEKKGKVYPDYDRPVYLMIDFKSDAEPTYQKLRSVLMSYENLLNNGVVIFISGNRPIEMITKDEAKWAALDGRPDDLGKGISPKLMPVVSTSFRKVSKWNGKEEISESDQQAIKALVEQTHAEGKLVRFWATPDNPNAWKQLQALGVDLINTDDLEGLSSFLNTQ